MRVLVVVVMRVGRLDKVMLVENEDEDEEGGFEVAI